MSSKNETSRFPLDEVENRISYGDSKGPAFGARHVQILLIAVGIGMIYATKYSFSIIIIAMNNSTLSPNIDTPVYNWDNINVILSSIFWSGMFFQLFGGYLGRTYGHKWFIFFSTLINGMSFILIPTAAALLGSRGVLVCRVIQGICQGIFIPLQACVIGTWAPPEERSRSASVIALGISTSLIMSSIIVGIVCKSVLGWPWAVYIFGIANCLWSVVWFFFGQQNPITHPSITLEEKKYIQITLGQEDNRTSPTPWMKIFSSRSVWAILIGQIGSVFVLTMLLTENASYLAHILKFDIDKIGIITGISIITGSLCGVFFAILFDYAIKYELVSILNCRRLCHLSGQFGNSAMIILSTFVPVEYSNWMILLICLQSVFMISIGIGGSEVNAYDISPSLAGIIYGVSGTLSDSCALFAPLLVHWIVTDLDDVESWRRVYFITAAVAILSALFFATFASDKRKKWETKPEENSDSVIGAEDTIFKL